ncbi:hypothetical protein AB0I98_38505 [Streptomyces sp. NPDC050211]|uniref:hypothetical protein n=1 Tax=Streptomyces sp. NPDC050211 TaxID=3154932 RepID=UPI003422A6D1
MRAQNIAAIGASAALLLVGMGSATPVQADVNIQASRTVEMYTSDRAPGGYAKVKVEWWGSGNPGRYDGRVTGSLTDREADGYCVQVVVKEDGHRIPLEPEACPKGEWQQVQKSFTQRENVVVQVCLTKSVVIEHCSRYR